MLTHFITPMAGTQCLQQVTKIEEQQLTVGGQSNQYWEESVNENRNPWYPSMIFSEITWMIRIV